MSYWETITAVLFHWKWNSALSLPRILLTRTLLLAASSPNCKLQLHCIPGQFVVVQHIYIASINFPRLWTTEITSPKWTSVLLVVSELFHLFIVSALFVGLRLQPSWSCHSDGQHNILMKNTVHIIRGKLSLYFCQVTRRNVLFNLITVRFFFNYCNSRMVWHETYSVLKYPSSRKLLLHVCFSTEKHVLREDCRQNCNLSHSGEMHLVMDCLSHTAQSVAGCGGGFKIRRSAFIFHYFQDSWCQCGNICVYIKTVLYFSHWEAAAFSACMFCDKRSWAGSETIWALYMCRNAKEKKGLLSSSLPYK